MLTTIIEQNGQYPFLRNSEDSSFFSKDSLSNRVQLSSNNATFYQSGHENNLDKDEPFETMEELEAQTIGSLLPDDDDLLSRVIGDIGFVGQINDRGDIDDDILYSGGGMELEVDNNSDVNKTFVLVVEAANEQLSGPNGLFSSEHPSKTLFIQNINRNVEDVELRALFEQYDIRAAGNAMKSLQMDQEFEVDSRSGEVDQYVKDVSDDKASNFKNGAEVDEHGKIGGVGDDDNQKDVVPPTQPTQATQKKKTWASLLRNNLKPTSDVSLEQYEAKGERLSFDFDDIDDIEDTMGFCLLMPKYFLFHEDSRLVPTWIQIHGLPPDCWSQKVLSMIGSEIGKPLYTDNLTQSRERLEYARLLVEVPIMGDRIYEVPITLPTGAQVDGRIVYKMLPEYCEVCKKIGHRKEDCRGASQSNMNVPRAGRSRPKSTGHWGRRRLQLRYRSRTRQTNQQPQNVKEPTTHNGLAIVVVHSPQPVAIEPPLYHEEVGAQHVHHVEVPNAEEELSTILEVLSSKEASSSSVDHLSQTVSSNANQSSAESSLVVSVTLRASSSASSQADSLCNKGKNKEVISNTVPPQSG
ncbi:hypothetical protein ZIOFF_035258 [Zingiber officinale]|uniref:DUF4283 domain-containing protein n=1 Tax=Zingiber officinale TaxID=94328 RepID=A0A8J5GG43_ZINOF|nr:hypothetical protein ZIOFF_035258 [Zingiber officinale]